MIADLEKRACTGIFTPYRLFCTIGNCAKSPSPFCCIPVRKKLHKGEHMDAATRRFFCTIGNYAKWTSPFGGAWRCGKTPQRRAQGCGDTPLFCMVWKIAPIFLLPNLSGCFTFLPNVSKLIDTPIKRRRDCFIDREEKGCHTHRNHTFFEK